jgi:hypothetical protein
LRLHVLLFPISSHHVASHLHKLSTQHTVHTSSIHTHRQRPIITSINNTFYHTTHSKYALLHPLRRAPCGRRLRPDQQRGQRHRKRAPIHSSSHRRLLTFVFRSLQSPPAGAPFRPLFPTPTASPRSSLRPTVLVWSLACPRSPPHSLLFPLWSLLSPQLPLSPLVFPRATPTS